VNRAQPVQIGMTNAVAAWLGCGCWLRSYHPSLWEGWGTRKLEVRIDISKMYNPMYKASMIDPAHKQETERTKCFRTTNLDATESRTISNIGWSYTIGMFDTCNKPEIITVGLKEKTAHFLLNEAARRLRSGVDLTKGRHRDMIGDVECEFRPVDPKWAKHLMGWAIWYYSGDEFPVLQAVYPDRENRFPEDSDFDTYFQQPLMQPEASMGQVENDFWTSADPSSSLFDWKFPDPPHTRVFLSKAVHSNHEPVTYVSHDEEDGAWQFLGDSTSGDEPPVVVCFHHPIDDDLTLKELADLPLGWWAERAGPGEPWVRYQHDQLEAEEE